jgi:ribosome-binding factor A
MTLDKRTRRRLLAHCDEMHDDDGIDPRDFFRKDTIHSKKHHKLDRLCRQVAETLDQVLAGEFADDALRCLRVVCAMPAPDASRLLVTLHADCEPEDFDRGLLEDRLAACKGRLRCEVAAAITRRKAPSLTFNIVGPDSTSSTISTEAQP